MYEKPVMEFKWEIDDIITTSEEDFKYEEVNPGDEVNFGQK
jgi:hypothetical protein